MIERAKEGAKFTALSGVSVTGRAMADGNESGPFRLAESASHLLHRAEQMAADRFLELRGESVTLRQFGLLAAIAEAKGPSQADLVRATGIDRSTMAEMLKRMQERGWITRVASADDQRAQSVHMAGAGSMILAASIQDARSTDEAILKALGKAKGRTFLKLLTTLAEKIDEQIEEAEEKARRQAKRKAKQRAKERAKEKAKQEKRKPDKPRKRDAAKDRGAN